MKALALTKLLVVAGLLLLASPPLAANEGAGSARALKAKYDSLLLRPEKSPFDIPLFIESEQTSNTLAGDIHSKLDQRFDVVKSELKNPRAWCEILILHPNINGCAVDAGDASLTIRLGSVELPAKFTYRIAQSTDDYLDVRLGAAQGPFGTTDYNFRIEAAPLDGQSTLLHLGYSYGYGVFAKFTLQTYFNTLGRDKVGFTIVDRKANGTPVYVDDLRGGIERNAMRYYLAIRSHLDALSAPTGARLEKSLQSYFAQTERYPLQLKERSGFLVRKRNELQRFRAEATASSGRASGG